MRLLPCFRRAREPVVLLSVHAESASLLPSDGAARERVGTAAWRTDRPPQ
jgi:hypothetical protein